jgi:hypothetical protein
VGRKSERGWPCRPRQSLIGGGGLPVQGRGRKEPLPPSDGVCRLYLAAHPCHSCR